MASVGFAKITGSKQGAVSSGANSTDSVGNNYVDGSDYVDQCILTAFTSGISVPINPLTSSPTGAPQQVPSTFTKYHDKASPLLWQALTSGESLEIQVALWRTTNTGSQQKYFTYDFKNAVLVNCQASKPDVLNANLASYHDMETWQFTFGSVTWTNVATGTSGSWSANKASS